MTATDSTVLRLTSDDPDVRLMLDVRDGSAAAFEELMLRYQTRVATVLEHLLGRRAANEDLAQDVFLRVFRARKSYVPAAKFSTWLFTIVNHVALNAMRSKSRRPEVQLPPADSGSHSHSLADLAPAASGQMPTRLVDKSEMREIVRRAVDQLSDRQRMAVLLNKFEDMSYAEIAVAMELTPPAVKSLLSRARSNLRQALEPYLERGDRPTPLATPED